MNEMLQVIIVGLKFIVPSIMLWFPLFGLWGNFVLDVIDGDILLALGMEENVYQVVDKFADLISYIFMLILGIRWGIKNTVIVLFVYRLIGQILFFITGNEIYFFLFQNFLEPLMLIYVLLILMKKSENKAFIVYRKHIILIWIGIFLYKFLNEWYLHYANIDISLIIFGFTG